MSDLTYDEDEFEEPEDFEDRMPNPLAVGSLIAGFFCPFLLPVAAIVIGCDAQRRTRRAKAKKMAKKIESQDSDFLFELKKERNDLSGARLTHSFTIDNKKGPQNSMFSDLYNTAIVEEEYDYSSGKTKRKVRVV